MKSRSPISEFFVAVIGAVLDSPKIVVAIVLVVLLLLPASVWAWVHYSHASKIRKVKQVAAQAFENRNNPDLTEEQRRQGFDDMRKAFEGLSPSDRQALWDERMAEGMRREDERMDQYFAM